jgi:type IV pilus assembly protein PilM
MGKAVGLEIHPRGIRAVHLSGSGKKVKVVRYVEQTVATLGGLPDPEGLQSALTAIFKTLPKSAVIASIDAHDTVTREIPVPFKSDDQIRKVIKYEAEHHLHDCDADDVVVQYTKVGESKEGTNLLVFAAKKDNIARRIEACRDSGVELLGIELDALAVVHAARFAGVFEDAPNCVLMNISHQSTEIIFVHDGTLRALRSVRMGMDSIAQGMAREMEIEFADADEKLTEIATGADAGDLIIPADGGLDDKADTSKSAGELERDMFQQKRDEFVARLKREFVRSSAALRADDDARIIACGPGLRVPGLLDLLSEKIGQSIEVFRPSDHFHGNVGDDKSAFDSDSTIALGLALHGIGAVKTPLDFRQENLKVANKFELLKGALAVSVTLTFFALMAASAFYLTKKRNLEGEGMFNNVRTNAYVPFNNIVTDFNGLGEALVPSKKHVDAEAVEKGDGASWHLALKRIVKSLKSMERHLTKKAGGEGLDPIQSALGRWNAIMGVVGKLHKEIEYIDIQNMDIEQLKVDLTIVVKNASTAAKVKKAISAIEEMADLVPSEDLSFTPIANSNYGTVRLEWKRPKGRRRRR